MLEPTSQLSFADVLCEFRSKLRADFDVVELCGTMPGVQVDCGWDLPNFSLSVYIRQDGKLNVSMLSPGNNKQLESILGVYENGDISAETLRTAHTHVVAIAQACADLKARERELCKCLEPGNQAVFNMVSRPLTLVRARVSGNSYEDVYA